MSLNIPRNHLRAGMVGVGMIFEDTYWPFFQQVNARGLYRRNLGAVEVELTALASRTGSRAAGYVQQARQCGMPEVASCTGPAAMEQLLARPVDVVCVATPDDRHFDAARTALAAGKHILIEKPSVLSLQQLDQLDALARSKGVLARVVYHKLADPDHKKLRTHVVDDVLKHVNNGYCSLLEPRQIAGQQFAEWITGRNPGTYVAVHYIKLIDFTFSIPSPPTPLPRSGGEGSSAAPLPWRLARVTATGQRGLVGPVTGPTWDSVQLQMVYVYEDGREAAFDIHTSWVTPDNFPGYVDQEVQFRFNNGVWIAHQRKRGVEVTVEGRTPGELKITPNHHYNGKFIEPWNERSQRGYGIEVIERFFEEAAFVEFGGPPAERSGRLEEVRRLSYADVSADRNTVATVQAMEAILSRHAAGQPGCAVKVNDAQGGLVLVVPGKAEAEVLYPGRV
jgi:predicted dehydrogenase